MIAIKRPNGELVYLDACTAFGVSKTASVTRNPIDGTDGTVSSTVTDHIAVDNPQINISGVISTSDFGVFKPQQMSVESLGVVSVLNNQYVENVVGIVETETDLSSSISGIEAGQPLTVISFDIQNKLTYSEVDSFLSAILENGEICSIFQFDKDMVLLKTIDSLICTNYSMSEDESTGDSPNIELSFEKIKVVTSRKVNVKIVEIAAAKSKAAGNKQSSSSGGTSPNVDISGCLEKVDALAAKKTTATDKQLTELAFSLSPTRGYINIHGSQGLRDKVVSIIKSSLNSQALQKKTSFVCPI